jgi:hypothetical protein
MMRGADETNRTKHRPTWVVSRDATDEYPFTIG